MTAVKHPAKYSGPLLSHLARFVDGAWSILDPFAGTGRVGLIRQHLVAWPDAAICAIELEPAWAAECKGNDCDFVATGDARHVRRLFCRHFDAVVTSPAYGNRMADAANWAPGRKHSTYTSAIRQTVGDDAANLQPGNAGAMQWGDEYRALHREVWAEMWEAIEAGGRLVLNVADHYRDGELQRVPEWHVSVLLALGFVLRDWIDVPTARYGFGANAELRAPELVILFEKPGDGPDWVYRPGDPGTGGLWDVKPEPVQLGLFGAAS